MKLQIPLSFLTISCTWFLLCFECLFLDPFGPQITACLRENLLKALPCHSPHREAVEVFFLLPECPVMHDDNNWESLVVPFAEAVGKMSDPSSGVLGKTDHLHLTAYGGPPRSHMPSKVTAKLGE